MATSNKALDCILGGAIGDSFGAEIEFMSLEEIQKRFYPNGLTKLIPAYGKTGHITDDTQMTLFTLDGLNSGGKNILENVHLSYIKWLFTQGECTNRPVTSAKLFKKGVDVSILEYDELYARRAPGNTCLSSLKATTVLGKQPKFPETYRVNNSIVKRKPSEGCGGVMRSAPFGLKCSDHMTAFDLAFDAAGLTHDGFGARYSAGVFAAIISCIYHDDYSLSEAIVRALTIGKKFHSDNPDFDEVQFFIQCVLEHDEKLSKKVYFKGDVSDFEQWNGLGWVGDEALVIALHSVLQSHSFKDAIIMAANHNGDSDSTAAIAGNIAGLIYGVPEDWAKDIELKDLMTKLVNKIEII